MAKTVHNNNERCATTMMLVNKLEMQATYKNLIGE